jgi:hypothetical protein
MVEQVEESVDVLASFSGGHIRPRAFLWKNRRYKITEVNLAYMARNGQDRIYFFAVSNGVNAFKLSFHPREMAWSLVEIYTGG